MTRLQVWSIHISNLLVGGTGLVYGWMCYFTESDDPFSIVNHPWQPHMQHFHIIVAPLLLFAVGVIWNSHVWARIRSGFQVHRKSGLALALLLFPMVFSGYAIQVTIHETWRELWTWLHVISSLLWLVFGLLHPLLPMPKGSQS